MKQYNNRILFFIFIGLLGIYVLTRALRSSGGETNVQTTLFTIDSNAVTEVKMFPLKAGRREVDLVRQGHQWEVADSARQALVSGGSMSSLLDVIARVDIKRILSRKKSQWDDYKVGDTTGTHVIVYAGKSPLAEWWIGEEAGPGAYGQGNSYIRMKGQDEVYAVSEYMGSQFNKTFDDWRNKVFLRLPKDEIAKIDFSGDTSFTLGKKDARWMIGKLEADSARVAAYLNGIADKNLYRFADDFRPSSAPDAAIGISSASTTSAAAVPGMPGNTASSVLATVKAWKRPEGQWVLNSSQHPGDYFLMEDSVMRKDLWPAKQTFIGKEK